MFKFLKWLFLMSEQDEPEWEKRKQEEFIWKINNPPPYSRMVAGRRGSIRWTWDEEKGGDVYLRLWDSKASFKAKEYRTMDGHNEADVKYYIETGKWP